MKNNRKNLWILAGLILLALFCAVLSAAVGSRMIPFQDVVTYLLGKPVAEYEAAVIAMRIPRTFFGLLAGAALGVCGLLMQSITRNPIADPSVLGVNSGAALFVVAGMVFAHISGGTVNIWLAFIGAALTALGVYGLASVGHGQSASGLRLALAGAAASMAASALTNALLMPDASAMDKFRFWQVGSLGAVTWSDVLSVWPFLLVGFVLAAIMAPYLNIMVLGDEMASSLGIKVGLIRALSALAGVLLCASITALAGPIAFVGLMVPHLIRLVCTADIRWMMPLCALAGGCLLLMADIVGRIVGGKGELEVGIVMALIGAPFFIYVVRKSRVQSL